MADQTTPAVLAALQTLYSDPDPASKKRANEWLEEFQHSVGFQRALLRSQEEKASVWLVMKRLSTSEELEAVTGGLGP